MLLALLASRAAATPFDATALGCERGVAEGLRTCLTKVHSATRKCYVDTGAACLPTDPRIAAALARFEERIRDRCPAATTVVQDAGYGPLFVPTTLVDRTQRACLDSARGLAARSFGGPHGAVLATADTTQRRCLERAMRQGGKLVERDYKAQSRCIRKTHGGGPCDTAQLATRLASDSARAINRVTAKCADLAGLVAIDPATFVARSAEQARCLVATAHGDVGPLALDCGPRAAVPVPARGTNVQVILDEATWGTRCGNGSPYAFWVRFAAAGDPVERVEVHLSGGGVCINGPECVVQSPTLFEALSDPMPTTGWHSNNATVNPFGAWTKVSVPYCTQDIHIGGGVTNAFPEITVHRFGAINVRAAMRWVRDALWAELDATTVEGYRPDRLTVLFGGSSAGGFGSRMNYHWVLDDLWWVNATAVPDSGVGLDNGGPDGMAAIGALVSSPTTPGWGVVPYLPPYCFASTCGVGPTLLAATSPRLQGTPMQQVLEVMNQVDNNQRDSTNFASTTAFVNTLRTSYCALQGLPGLRFFLPSNVTPLHGLLNKDSTFPSLTAAGVALGDWLEGAANDPDALVDAVSEGTLVASYPGVSPFACAVGTSGAFVGDVSGF